MPLLPPVTMPAFTLQICHNKSSYQTLTLKPKNSFTLLEADILDGLFQLFLTGEILSALHQTAQITAQHAAVQLMTGIGR